MSWTIVDYCCNVEVFLDETFVERSASDSLERGGAEGSGKAKLLGGVWGFGAAKGNDWGAGGSCRCTEGTGSNPS